MLKCNAEQGPADVSSPLCCSREGLFSQQSSAQSVTAAAGMRLWTPRRRSDGFSQVRAAPCRPTHQPRVAPSRLPPVRTSVSRVSDCSDIRLSQAVSGCCEEHTAAGRSVLAAFNVFSSAQLNQRTSSEVFLLPPSPPCRLSDGHTGSPRTRH